MFPVCPSEYRPGCGHTARPCGLPPTWMRATSLPVKLLNPYTTPSYLPETHSILPLADTPPMSGLPPPGIVQVSTILRLANEITLTFPAPRSVTYKDLPSRLGISPCGMFGVLMEPTFLNVSASMSSP
jgi:hypothetical protein